MAAAIAYGFWVGRERPRAYFGLMLFLTSAVMGVFASQDLFLFYVFFEAMMIPLYFLIGVWGGPGRLGATVKFVIYTMAGSLLMLAAVIVFGLQQGTFDLVDRAPERQHLALPRLRRRVRGQGAALPAPRLAAGRLPRVVARGRRRALGRDLEGRDLRIHPDLLRRVPGAVRRLAQRDPRARRDRARLRLAARVPRARHPRRDRLLEPCADGADHDRRLRQGRRSASAARSCSPSTTGCSRPRSSCSRGRSSGAPRPGASTGWAAWPAGGRRWRR